MCIRLALSSPGAFPAVEKWRSVGRRGRDGRGRREKGGGRDAGYSEQLGGLLHDSQQWDQTLAHDEPSLPSE